MDLSVEIESDTVIRPILRLSAAFFFVFMGAAATQQFLIPLLSVQTGRSHAACAWILALVYFSSILWRTLCSYTLDWLGAKWSLVGGMFTYTLFVACLYLLQSYPLFLAAAVVWGWGAASIWITGPSLILENTPTTRYGTASGLFYAAVHCGQALGVYLLGAILTRSNPPTMLLVALAITLVGNGFSLSLPQQRIHRDAPQLGDVLGVLRDPKNRVLAFILFAASIGFGLVLSSFSSLVAEEPAVAFWVSLGFYGMRLPASTLGGWLSDRLGRPRVLVGIFLLAAAALAMAASSPTSLILLVTAMTLGLQMGVVPATVMAVIGDVSTTGTRHLAFGAIYAWSNLGVGLTIVFGQYLRLLLGGYGACFAVFSGVFWVCAWLSLRLRKP